MKSRLLGTMSSAASCFVALALASPSPASAQLSSQYGILDLTTNGGINPNTGVAWQAGDQYRLAFHTADSITATSNDPAVYDGFATAQANLSTLGDGSITSSTGWTALVWVNEDPLQEQGNALSDPRVRAGISDVTGGAVVGGAGVPVYAMDGTTSIGRNNSDIIVWSNPFDGNATLRLASGSTNNDSDGNPVTATQNVYYSPFLDQFGLGDTANVHGPDVWTGGNLSGHVNALGDITLVGSEEVRASHGNTNANNTGRIWNRFQRNNPDSKRVYALSAPLTVMAGGGDYATWAANFPDADLSDPTADYDGDGVSNDGERLFGLDPTDPGSLNPIAVPVDATAGTFSFTRRDDALTGMVSSVETSTDLLIWTPDVGATLTPGAPVDEIETVDVTLSAGLSNVPTLFVRVRQSAEDDT